MENWQLERWSKSSVVYNPREEGGGGEREESFSTHAQLDLLYRPGESGNSGEAGNHVVGGEGREPVIRPSEVDGHVLQLNVLDHAQVKPFLDLVKDHLAGGMCV